MKKYRYIYTEETFSSKLDKNALYIDIETTGFQRTSSFLTIIGLAWQENDSLIIEQWFNETGHQGEPLLLIELERFFKQHSNLPKLIHYNGTTFDLPYLKSKYEQYHLPTSLSACESLDLYHIAKKFRTFLSLDGIKQKNLEECFGLFRKDELSGQELINTYLEGIRYEDSQLLDFYLLHNKEDMEGMIFLQNLLAFDLVFDGNFEILEWIENLSSNSVSVRLAGDFSLHKPISVSVEEIHFSFATGQIRIQIPIRHIEARFFYENYKDYYFLPAEDCAMHKSVAEYVEKEYRIKATKETCYTKKTADYLPLPLPDSTRLRKNIIKDCCGLNLFYECYNGSTAYVQKNITSTKERVVYLTQLLKYLL